MAHNRTPAFTLEVSGRSAKMSKSGLPQVGGGNRGAVSGFSRQSRMRLLYLMSTLALEHRFVFFATLTYPDDYPTTGLSKKHLKAWLERLRRRHPESAAIWRLEYQKRGAPHFHLLIYPVWDESLHSFRQWLSESWYQVVGSGDKNHLLAGTNCENLLGDRQVTYYVAKYVAKVDTDCNETGRIWGIHNRKALPVQKESRNLTARQYWNLRRIMRRLTKSDYANGESFTLFDEKIGAIYSRLDDLLALFE